MSGLLKKFNEFFDLIATKMFAPSVSIRNGDDVVWVSKIVPYFVKFLRSLRVFLNRLKPYLFQQQRFFIGIFLKPHERKSIFSRSIEKVKPGRALVSWPVRWFVSAIPFSMMSGKGFWYFLSNSSHLRLVLV